jgi:hypothetical protein
MPLQNDDCHDLTQYDILEGLNFHQQCCENHKFHMSGETYKMLKSESAKETSSHCRTFACLSLTCV